MLMYGKSAGLSLDKIISQWPGKAHLHNNYGNCMELLFCSVLHNERQFISLFVKNFTGVFLYNEIHSVVI